MNVPPILYYHPFASFCQKVLIALYENDTEFEPKLIDLGDTASRLELERVWPMVKFPVLDDVARSTVVPESSLIIGYLQEHYPGPVRLIPQDSDRALDVNIIDRLFDNYIAPHVTKVVIDRLRPEGRDDPEGVLQAKAGIVQAYRVLEQRLGDGPWACGEQFTLADCAAAPNLFYANIVVPFAGYSGISEYYRRLLSRPSFARVVDDAKPYRRLFPLPWPEGY
jgi:glutathione S-transferase